MCDRKKKKINFRIVTSSISLRKKKKNSNSSYHFFFTTSYLKSAYSKFPAIQILHSSPPCNFSHV